MNKTTSLLSRLTISVSLVTLAMAAMMYTWVYYQILWAADRANEGSLISQTREVLENVTEAGGTVHFDVPDDLYTSADETRGIFRYSIRDSDGAPLFSSAWPTAIHTDVSAFTNSKGLYQAEHSQPSPDIFVGSIMAKTLGGHHLIVQVERSSDDLDILADTLLNELFLQGAWFAIPFLLVLLAIISWTIRRAITPLNTLSREATSIGPSSTDIRLRETNVPAEILPLVKAMNSVLDRLDAGFRVQREFTADAAHELRTPLAILTANVETLDDRELAKSLGEDVDAVSRVVLQLLKDAQLGALTIAPSDIVDLTEIAAEVLELLRPIASREGKSIVVSGPASPVPVHGDKETIFNALRNLIENALRHSPLHFTVEAAIDRAGRVEVRDHGPGIPPEHWDKIFTRFWRGGTAGGGAGLGLSIVKKTMDLHGGTVSISETPGGGATFSLEFRPVHFS